MVILFFRRCKTSEDGPFTPEEDFTQSVTTDGRKLYNSGVFEMAMFEDEARVYLKCEMTFCYEESDTLCTTVSPVQAAT